MSTHKKSNIYGENGDFVQMQSVLSLIDIHFPIVLEGNNFKGNSGTKGIILISSDISEDGPFKGKKIEII